MARSIYQAIGVEREEQTPVLLLLLQSFFLGIFYGTLEIGASTLFLGVFEHSMISNAFLVSGIAGIILTSLYSWLQTRISFSKLAIFNLLGIFLITAALRFGLDVTSAKWLIFFVFVMMGPLYIVALVGFWGGAGRIFTLRQGKRLFGLIDTGLVVGIIISTYAIPLLLNFNFQIKNLLSISALSIIIALVFQFVMKQKFSLDADKSKQEKEEEKADTSFKTLFKERYIVLMMLFVSLSMIAAFFIYTSFLAVTDEKYPNPNELANFLSIFTGTLMIFTILVKTFVYGNLLKTYGLKTSLLLAPILLILFTIVASIVGSFGFTIDTKTFIFFFLLMLLSRLFSVTLKMSIEAPSLKLLYQSLSARIRHNVQAKIDGTVNEFSALISGLLLAGIAMLSFFKLIHYTYFLVVVLIAWLIVAFRLYKEYRRSLEKSLASAKDSRKDQSEEINGSELNMEYLNSSPLQIINYIKVAVKEEPELYEEELIKLITHDSVQVRKFVINEIKNNQLYSAIDVLKKRVKQEKNPEIERITTDTIQSLQKISGEKLSEKEIIDLSKSRKNEDRKLTAAIIGELDRKELVPLLFPLLKDADFEVRIEAIKSTSRLKTKDYCVLLADNLQIAELRPYAVNALINIGDAALAPLEQLFHKTGVDNKTLIEIVRIYGHIGGEKSLDLLLKKISYHRKDVVSQVLKSLRKCNYLANDDSAYRIYQSVKETISILAWNIAAIISINEEEIGPLLKEAFEEEIASNYSTIFLLLSLAYDPESISHVKENLESETSEGIGFAIELLDLFVAEELKPVLFPVLEDTSYTEKVRILQNHFPIEKMDSEDLLNAIVNRDINMISSWTKACAFYSLINMKEFKITDGIIAHLFNKDELLQEISAYILYKFASQDYENLTNRIDNRIKKNLDNKIKSVNKNKSTLMIEKLFSLKKVDLFKNLPSDLLVDFVKNIEEIIIEKGETILLADKMKLQLLIFVKGLIRLTFGEERVAEFSSKEMLDLGLISDIYNEEVKLEAQENTLIYQIGKNKFNELISNNKYFINAFIEHSNTYLEKFMI